MVARTDAINLILPFPPSVNTYWRRNGKTVFIAQAGKAFRRDGMAAIYQQLGKPKTLTGRLSVDVELRRGDRRSYDLDNYGKGLLDLLMQAGVIGDDSQVDSFAVRRGKVQPGKGVALVTITEEPA